MRLTTIALGIAVGLVAIAAVAWAAKSEPAPAPATAARAAQTDTATPRYQVHVTPEMIRHSRIQHVLYFVGQAYGIGVLLLILGTRWSARMRDLASRAAKRPFLVAMLFFVLFSIVSAVLEFPLDFYGGYVVPHQFDLTNQGFAGWMGDQLKGLGVSLVIGSVVSALALLGIRKVRRWWLALWLGSIPLMVFFIVVAPIFIDPLFNKFVPLRDPVLKQALLDEASRAGIEGSRVYQVDKSKQTKTMNAYVTGLGPTKRIVLWDTTLEKMTQDEILAVMAHEMGHYVLNHIWKGLAFGIGLSFIALFFGQKVVDWGVAKWGSRWGFESAADPAALPWLFLVIAVFSFFLSPVTMGFSRHIEHEADVFGLDLTHYNGPMASAFVKLAEDSKSDPSPNRFIEIWLYSHPSLQRRIDFVLSYEPERRLK